jgi:hypothetical protein
VNALGRLACTARGWRLVYGVAAFAFYWFLLAQGQYLVDGDAYFHVQIAREILARGVVTSLPQMAHAIHAERYVDYHFLYHYALVPFVAISPDPLAGARVAFAVMAALAVMSLDVLLCGMRVRQRWFWALFFLLASPIFTGRLLFGRGVILFLSVFFLYVFCLVRRRYRRAGLLAMIAVWTYPGFPVLAGLAGLLSLAGLLQGSARPTRPLVWTGVGLLFALVVHPAFPRQFYGYWLEFVVHSLAPASVEQIAEWLPAPPHLLLIGLALPLTAFVIALLTGRRHDVLGSALLAACVIVLVAATASLKPFEYAVPVLVIYAARQSRGLAKHRAREALYVGFTALMLLWSVPQIYSRMNLQVQLQDPRHEFAAADWLARHTPPGTLIALPWDEFPEFYFRNPRNRYLFGLNPVYSFGADTDRYLRGRAFFDGLSVAGANPVTGANSAALLRSLGTEYAVLDRRRHTRVLMSLLDGPAAPAALLYQNEKFLIVRLSPADATARRGE